MRCDELFLHLNDLNETESFDTVGLKLDYKLEIDHKSKIIRLLFQDSNGLCDWCINFYYFSKFYKKVYKNQESENLIAHSGFVKAYKSGNDTIMSKAIAAIKSYPDYKVVIAGWSHGGAMTQLAAEDLNYRTRTDPSDINSGVKPFCITFGSPIVFANEESAKYVRSCCSEFIEIAQNNDIVSYLPPFKGFTHVGLSKRIGSKFSIKKFLKPAKYHTQYYLPSLYDNSDIDISKIDV